MSRENVKPNGLQTYNPRHSAPSLTSSCSQCPTDRPCEASWALLLHEGQFNHQAALIRGSGLCNVQLPLHNSQPSQICLCLK